MPTPDPPPPTNDDGPPPIGPAERKRHLELIHRALGADDDHERTRTLGEALLMFGPRIVYTIHQAAAAAEDGLKRAFQHLSELAVDLVMRWLDGRRLSAREDETELRAAAALEVIQLGVTQWTRLAAKALLSLPKGHPKREVAVIRAMLEGHIAATRGDGDWDSVLLCASMLVDNQILPPSDCARLVADVRAGAAAARQAGVTVDDANHAKFLRSSAWQYFTWSLESRDAGHDALEAQLAAARDLMDEARRALPNSLSNDLAMATMLIEAGQTELALELLVPLVGQSTPVGNMAASLEAMIRVSLGHYARAIEVLAPSVPREEQEYLLALDDATVQSAGEHFALDSVNLASAYAAVERWPEALAALDRVKSPRLRHAQRLRQSAAGQELLRLEAELASTRRGVPGAQVLNVSPDDDPLGSRITRQASLLEQYRSKRPDLAAASLAPPTIEQLASALDRGEALVCLGSCTEGLLVAAILRGDREQPSGCWIQQELDQEAVLKLFMGGEHDTSAWWLELAARTPVDPEPALAALLAAVDRAFGDRLAAFLRERGVRKATVVPHRLLHLIPFWALHSLGDVDVRVASSAGQWLESRRTAREVVGRLASVGNPTLDLGLARVEAECVAAVLGASGWRTAVLLERAAQEDAIRDALKDAGVFHFAGHGFGKPMEPLMSSLLAHPDPAWGWPAAGDLLARAAREVQAWVEMDGGRYADGARGRLIEFLDQDGVAVERLLEYAERGTLWGAYDGGELLQLAELFTTADILIEDTFRTCAIAFLGACQSGQAAMRLDVDEGMGLPGALQIAGVSTVISALWPISDTAALLFASVFYRRLAAEPAGRVDVAALVRASGRDLARLAREDAARILADLRRETEHRPSQARLDLAIAELGHMPERPFAHPYHWAAYFTLGAETVTLRAG